MIEPFIEADLDNSYLYITIEEANTDIYVENKSFIDVEYLKVEIKAGKFKTIFTLRDNCMKEFITRKLSRGIYLVEIETKGGQSVEFEIIETAKLLIMRIKEDYKPTNILEIDLSSLWVSTELVKKALEDYDEDEM